MAWAAAAGARSHTCTRRALVRHAPQAWSHEKSGQPCCGRTWDKPGAGESALPRTHVLLGSGERHELLTHPFGCASSQASWCLASGRHQDQGPALQALAAWQSSTACWTPQRSPPCRGMSTACPQCSRGTALRSRQAGCTGLAPGLSATPDLAVRQLRALRGRLHVTCSVHQPPACRSMLL